MFLRKLFTVGSGKVNLLLFAVCIFLVSFPKFDPTYSFGLDASLPYAYNYFFNTGIQYGTDILFVYGPLAFLKMPLPVGINLPLSITFTSLVYFTFIYLFLFLGHLINKRKWILHAGILSILCQILVIDDLLVGITAVSILIYHETKNQKWFIIPLLSAVLGLYIKVSIGIVSLLMLFSYSIFYYRLVRDIKKPILLAVSGIILYFLIWLVIYGNLNGSLDYFWASFQIAKGYSLADAVYPNNNWWLLAGFIISFLLIPVLSKDKKIFLLYWMCAFSAFAVWKHAYTREEEFHLQAFYTFLILFFSVFGIFIDRIKPLHIILMLVSCITLYRNMCLTELYHINTPLSFNGINNFRQVFFNYKQLTEKSMAISKENIQSRKLPKEVLEIIGKAEVDVYPWDFSFFPANNLSWKPRPVIQSYAAYTEWLDKEDATYFSSDESAPYIIWELLDDRYGQSGFCSIDNRYLLNDEPTGIYQLFNHYKPIYKNSKIILFQKTEKENLFSSQSIGKDTAVWNQWIKIPSTEDGILRVKIKIARSSIGTLKAYLYKDEEFRMDCKLINGNVFQYRIIPNSAERGIWINPLITSDINTNTVQASEVDEIKFTCSNKNIMKENIFMEWEKTEIRKNHILMNDSMNSTIYNGKFKTVFSYFMKSHPSSDSLIFHSLNDFENKYSSWTGDAANISSDFSFRGKKSELLNTDDEYSSTFTFPVGKLTNDSTSLIAEGSVWVNMPKTAGGSLVVSLESNEGVLLWKPRKLEDYINDRNEWQQVLFTEKFSSIPHDARLGIYIINNNKKKMWIDDFDIKLYRRNE
ncbi:MAG: hypothetical protein HY840_10415 [Bacteroidetes bacterium]|nr:hypothetical protein [Bacteroidota bacterium]